MFAKEAGNIHAVDNYCGMPVRISVFLNQASVHRIHDIKKRYHYALDIIQKIELDKSEFLK